MTGSIRSEQRGFHWVAWIEAPETGKPLGQALFVGQSREEAEARAAAWCNRQ